MRHHASKCIRAARRAIAERKRFVRWFEDNCPGETKGNVQHSYFVELLENVLGCLNTCLPSQQEAAVVSSQQDTGHMFNSFAALKVDELPDEEPEPSATIETAVPRKTCVLQPPSNPEDVEEDELYARLCFHDELYAIHKRLKAVWNDYKAKKVDLVTASLITNTAYLLAAIKEFEFDRHYPTCCGPVVAFRKFLHFYMRARGLDRDSTQDTTSACNELRDSNSGFGFATSIFMTMHSILEKFYTRSKTAQTLNTEEKQTSYLLNLREHKEKTPRGSEILLPILVELRFLEHEDPNLPADDLFSTGIFQLLATGKIHVWLCLACWVTLDTHDTLGQQLERPFEELCEVTSRLKLD